MEINLAELSTNTCYHLLTQTVVPRPIAWVLTKNISTTSPSSYNLAPFSFFNAISADPPLIVLGFTIKTDGSAKDTWVNLTKQKECVVHLAAQEQLDDLVQTSAELDYGISEITGNNLPLEPFTNLPRLKTAPVAMACKLHSQQTFGKDETSMVLFCEITQVYIDDKIAQINEKGRIVVDVEKYMPPGRLGGTNYATPFNVTSKKRP